MWCVVCGVFVFGVCVCGVVCECACGLVYKKRLYDTNVISVPGGRTA